MTSNSTFHIGWTRCPCCCGGEGLIILVNCPQCKNLFGVCDEVDTVITDIRTLEMDGTIDSPVGRPCFACGMAQLKDFERSDFQRIIEEGFVADDVFRMPVPFPNRSCPIDPKPLTYQENKEAQRGVCGQPDTPPQIGD